MRTSAEPVALLLAEELVAQVAVLQLTALVHFARKREEVRLVRDDRARQLELVPARRCETLASLIQAVSTA